MMRAPAFCLIVLGCFAGLVPACVETEGDADPELLSSTEESEVGMNELTLGDPSGPVSAAASTTLTVRARKGVYWKYCTITTGGVNYNGSGTLNVTAKVSCDSTVTNIGLHAETYAKQTSTGPSYYFHGTDGGTVSGRLTRSVTDTAGCIVGHTAWWGGLSRFSIKFPSEWYPLAENGISTSGTTASGSLGGYFTSYGCAPYGW